MNKFTPEQKIIKDTILEQMQDAMEFIQSLPQDTRQQQQEVQTIVFLLDKTIAAIDNIFGYY